MINNIVKKITLGALIVATSLTAEIRDYEFSSNSLVGIEGGLDMLGYEYGTPTNNTVNSNVVSHTGLKIGAESEDFRVFLSGRYHFDANSKHDYIVTYGGEIQYKFNVSRYFNAFVGANAGIAIMEFRAQGESFTRTFNDPYFGGDLGVNFHLGKGVDWEFGGRVVSIQASNMKDDGTGTLKTYYVNQMISAYTSIIFKWQMN